MLPGVLPPAGHLGRVESARERVVAVHVGDLELAARRRLQRRDDVEDVGRVAVEADDCVRRRRRVEPRVDDARLLDDVGHGSVLAVDDDAEVLRIVDLLDEDPCPGRALRPLGEARRLRVLEDVVAEHDDERRASGEVPRHADDLGDAARLGLHLVREIELEDRVAAAARCEPPVSEQVDHLPGVPLPGDEEHVGDPGELKELERVVDHRPAPDRQQVLVRDAGQLAEAGRLAAGADEALRLHAGILRLACACAHAPGAPRTAVFRSRTPGTARTAAIHT